MNHLKTSCGLLVLWVAGVVWGADALTPEQKEVMQFMEKMYSYDPMTFESGYFLKKSGAPLIRNKVPAAYSAIKFSPEKMCSFLRLFFVDEVFEKKKEKFGGGDCEAPNRYPYLGAEDISSVTRVEDIPAPYVATPVVSGNRAKVEVFPAGNNKISNPPSFDLGRNLYFLTKTENGWRVTNVMIHTKWPDLDDGTHNCYFSLARPANDEERKEFPKHCR